ncbi:MAG TPA: methylated-DNA--[protein]-cysteine S-methyltransferase [Candidatus Ozemobacteraceae bacterium]|nr:methylated-DNA--[protein]-cysteine S-methyltransferase [Candidatus Ozemobacteraceae bacterium]
MNERHAFFDSPLGRCALAWNSRGICALALPDRDDAATLALLRKHVPASKEAAATGIAKRAVTFVRELLSGNRPAPSACPPLDLSRCSNFYTLVYTSLQHIGPGTTISYGELAATAGKPGAARLIGRIVGANPLPLLIPCHRVIGADGRLHGFSAPGGIDTKQRILNMEGTPLPLPRRGRRANPVPPDFGEATRALADADPVMKRLIDRVGPCRLEIDRLSGLFEALLESIVYQQLTGKAAATIHGRLLDLFRPKPRIDPLDLLRASDEELRGAGISGPKIAAMRDLAEKAASGELPTLPELEHLDDETIIEHLTRVRGIGRWTVEMLLLFRLGRPDILSPGDYGLRKGYAVLYNGGTLPTPRELAAAGERWKPWRSIASWYLWRAAEGVRLPAEQRRPG